MVDLLFCKGGRMKKWKNVSKNGWFARETEIKSPHDCEGFSFTWGRSLNTRWS